MRKARMRHPRLSVLVLLASVFVLTFGLSRTARAAQNFTLIGTVVIEGGGTAFFSQGDSFWTAHEGDDLGGGARLVEVRQDRVVVEQAGVRREILFNWGARTSGGGGAIAARPDATQPEGEAAKSAGTSVAAAEESGWLGSRDGDRIRARLMARQMRWKKQRGRGNAEPPVEESN